MEVWKNIKGYDGLYEISNWGNVKSLNYNNTGKSQMLKPRYVRGRYKAVTLCKDCYHKQITIHRLVAQAFIPNPNNYPQVNHIDEDISNNHMDNLEWCTSEYNLKYGTRNDKISRALSISVIGTNIKTREELILPSATYGNSIGFDHSCIIKCCKGHRKTHKGYTWRYA